MHPRFFRRILTLGLSLAAVCLTSAAAAQDASEPQQAAAESQQSDQDPAASGFDAGATAAGGAYGLSAEEVAQIGPGGKRMVATRVTTPPVLDGLVNEDVWNLADVVSDFLQREPDNGKPASERTEVRILFDDDNLYVGFKLYDREPDKIVARDMQRDSRLATEDTIAIALDTFHDHRNSVVFRVNPLGTKYDAAVKDESAINSEWDEKWEAAARITEEGWEAEMVIPWKILRFDTGTHLWGVDFKREIRRRNEEANWSNYYRGFDFRHVSKGGHLLGLQDLKLTGRYRLKPYVTGGYTSLNATDTPLSDGTGDFGIDNFKIQLTPNLTADLTVNTDFAQVEDDQERVNLTRFPLFFSERREFFLEGSDKFSFGPSSGMEGFGSPLASLFHSRNIGLYSGIQVPMIYGAKLSGKIGGLSVGFVNAQTGSDAELDISAKNYGAIRVKQDLFQRSSVGLIMTNVQRGNGEYNRVAGLDATFRFFEHFDVGGYVAQSRDSGIDGVGWIGSFGTGWNGDLWAFNADVNVIEDDFDTDLGFLQRRDIIRQNYSVSWKPRPDALGIRQFRNSASVSYTTDMAGQIQSRDQNLSTWITFQSGDTVTLRFGRNFERLPYSFKVSGIAQVVAGDYEWDDWNVSVHSSGARKLSGRLSYSGGGFYDGTRQSVGLSGTLRINAKASLSPGYDLNRIDLPSGAFDTHVVRMRGQYNFSDRWLTNALVQYNSVSDQLSVYARLNYIYRTGDDFFLVFKSSTRYDAEFYGLSDRAIIAKATRSFEF